MKLAAGLFGCLSLFIAFGTVSEANSERHHGRHVHALTRRSSPALRPGAEFHNVHIDLHSPLPEFDVPTLRKRQENGAANDAPSQATGPALLAAEQAAYDYFGKLYPHLLAEQDVFVYDGSVDSNGMAYVYLVQVVNGLVITNREAMAAVFNGSVVSSAGNFLNSSQTTAAKLVSNSAKTSVTRAVQVLIKHDYETYGLTAPSPFPTLNSSTKFYPGDNYTETEVVGMEKLGYIEPMYAELEYFVLANGAVDLVWTIDNQDEAGYWTGFVISASAPEGTDPTVHEVISYSSAADSTTYNAIPFTGNGDPTVTGFKAVREGDVAIKEASPQGWTADGLPEGIVSSGNNVVIGFAGLGDAEAGLKNLTGTFNGTYDFTNPLAQGSITSSITNLFATTNWLHDVLYIYGFDEASGNFQKSNYGKAPAGEGDPILGFALFGSLACPRESTRQGGCSNNANFATPPDGKSGVMNYYLFTQSDVPRDSGIDRGVVAHEIMHGVTNRLVGGRRDAACIDNQEAGGMGEGWGDTLALVLELKQGDAATDDKTMGAFVMNNPKGIRASPYSTGFETNKLHFGVLDNERIYGSVHAIGTVWATMLFEVFWQMYAVNPTFGKIDDPKGTGANNVFMSYLITALKLTPCNPTMVQARDAFLTADATLGNKKYLCAIWKGFAKRGLGANATGTVTPWMHRADWTVPEGCTPLTDAEKTLSVGYVAPTGATVSNPSQTGPNNLCEVCTQKNGTATTVASKTGTATATAAATSTSKPAAGEKVKSVMSVVIGLSVFSAMFMVM